jgi:hypothetical protein
VAVTFSDGGGQWVVTRRLLLVSAVVLLVAAGAAVSMATVLWLGNKSQEHPCVPDAASTFQQYVPPELLPPAWDADQDQSFIPEDDCHTDKSSYSIKPDGESPLGLTISYERFGATWKDTGASIASQRFAAQRPPDATEIDLSYEPDGDEGYLDAAAHEGFSTVELIIRDRNVLVRVSYRVDQSLSRATSSAGKLGHWMLEALNDYLTN